MTKPRFLLLALCTAALALPLAAQPVSVQVDAAKKMGPLKPVWAFFGHDEPNYTYMKDGRKLVGELASLSPGQVYIRTHFMLTTGDVLSLLKQQLISEPVALQRLLNLGWDQADALIEIAAIEHSLQLKDEAAAGKAAAAQAKTAAAVDGP